MTENNIIGKLEFLKTQTGKRSVAGLNSAELLQFFAADWQLVTAIEEAHENWRSLPDQYKLLLKQPESEVVNRLQGGIRNFYDSDYLSPFVPLAARGPWIVTTHGAVLYETGGYGMLGLGHAPSEVLSELAKPHVMANVMTSSISQHQLTELLRSKIGKRRVSGFPYDKFIFLNSGSEAMTVALRISDAKAKLMTDPGGRYADRKITFLSLDKGFHGRTCRPARVSHSSQKKYGLLASFRGESTLWTVIPNDLHSLREAFARAEREGVYFEAVVFEPVMGEGQPGVGLTPEFYAEARRLVSEHDSLLIIDSIQAGLRAHGCLSIVDYPGFESLPAPDMESFSKAINAGQFPLSALALSKQATELLAPGLYGNTMTANPRGLAVAVSVLEQIDATVSENIVTQGAHLKQLFLELKSRLPECVLHVSGTGLLLGVELASHLKVTGSDGLEQQLRRRGLNVIHGGTNSLRYTPHFRITAAESQLILSLTEEVIRLNQTAGGK